MFAFLRAQHAMQHPLLSSTFWNQYIEHPSPSKISRPFMWVHTQVCRQGKSYQLQCLLLLILRCCCPPLQTVSCKAISTRSSSVKRHRSLWCCHCHYASTPEKGRIQLGLRWWKIVEIAFLPVSSSPKHSKIYSVASGNPLDALNTTC